MTKSFENVIGGFAQYMQLSQIGGEEAAAPYFDQAVESLYDYLREPNISEMAQLQSVLIQILANPELKAQMAQGGMSKEQTEELIEDMDLTIGNVDKMGRIILNAQTSRVKAARETALPQYSGEELIELGALRLAFAKANGKQTELLMALHENQQVMRTGMVDGLSGIISYDKLSGFMGEVAARLEQEDFKTAFKFVAGFFGKLQESAQEAMQDLDIEHLQTLGEAEAQQYMVETVAKKQAKATQTILMDYVREAPEDIPTLKRIYKALEDSAIAAGFIAEDAYIEALKTNIASAMSVYEAFDQKYAFDADAALKASKTTGGKPGRKGPAPK